MHNKHTRECMFSLLLLYLKNKHVYAIALFETKGLTIIAKQALFRIS